MNSEAWHRIEIFTHPDGSATVCEATNDNLDHGCPTENAMWSYDWPDAERAKRHCGVSRRGCTGVRVEVYHDGEKV